MNWSDPGHDVLGDIQAAIARDRAAYEFEQRHPKGSESNPYDLFVPGWYVDMCEEQGETVEQVAERVFRPDLHVKITVVR